jgi:choline dehydrogenase
VLSTPEDIADVQEGARLLRTLTAAQPLSDIIESEYMPGPACQSESQILDDFRARAGTVYHASCTCAMGADPVTSVVNSRLQVHGLEALRVVDASVFPYVTSGNTNAPTMMVAERAADLILNNH